jgi:N6-L-threonylcarbamoyladenine synthase
MKILGIETSCDETALSLLDVSGSDNNPKFNVINTALFSQIELHKEYGGVYPSLAKREHAKNLIPLLDQMFEGFAIKKESLEELAAEQLKTLEEIFSREPELLEAFLKYIPTIEKPDIDMIAVTYGPGLEPALWVGINFARALSYIWQIPVMPTNHMEGHIVSVLKDTNDEIEFPMISLLISGGHTELILIKNWGDYEIIGKTLDDAVGEAFDKVARLMDLEYPGGPKVSKLAEEARSENLNNEEVKLPRPMLNSGDYNFSFSGIKTAVLYMIQKMQADNSFDEETKKAVALEFENAVTEVLFKKTSKAIEEFGAKRLIIGGGVIANKHIRETFSKLDTEVSVPEFELATDNAVMIAMAGYLKSLRIKPEVFPEIKAEGNLEL